MSNDTASTLSAEQAEAMLRDRLRGRVRHLRVLVRVEGVVLHGASANYYGKQMAQHYAHKLLGVPILANEIEVRSLDSSTTPGPPGEAQ
jgi:hypothetical protein